MDEENHVQSGASAEQTQYPVYVPPDIPVAIQYWNGSDA